MSQLGCRSSGNKLQRLKKGPWSLGKRKTRRTWGKERGKVWVCSREQERAGALS